jgi:CubicO group peptidase (beta-lactamase class C family)
MNFLKLSVLILALLCAGLAAAYGTGLFNIVWGGYPPVMWPASGDYDTVSGDPEPIPRHPDFQKLNQRGVELFKNSESRALLAMRDGRLVLETYAERVSQGTRLNSYSLVKSLVGALVLKAQADGRIESLEDPVGTYLPGFGSSEFQMRPVRSFLEMRSGLDFERDGPDKQNRLITYNPFGALARLHAGGLSAVEAELEITRTVPGRFSYQNVNTAVLGKLLSHVYGQPLPALLAEKIWQPAGAGDAYWLQHAEVGDVTAYCCLYAAPRDWIRIGRFLMRNGDAQSPFLPLDYWREFFGKHYVQAVLSDGEYGLHIRHNILDRQGEKLQGQFTYMMGQGGQIVYMMPEKDLVVVRFGERHSLLHSTLYSAWNSVSQ